MKILRGREALFSGWGCVKENTEQSGEMARGGGAGLKRVRLAAPARAEETAHRQPSVDSKKKKQSLTLLQLKRVLSLSWAQLQPLIFEAFEVIKVCSNFTILIAAGEERSAFDFSRRLQHNNRERRLLNRLFALSSS